MVMQVATDAGIVKRESKDQKSKKGAHVESLDMGPELVQFYRVNCNI